MKTGLDGLLLGGLLLAWGAQALLPWRLAGLPAEVRRSRAWIPLALLIAGTLAAFAHLQAHPDAAVTQGLYPFRASNVGRILTILFPALALADALLVGARRSLEPLGWRIAAGFGLAFLLAASWAAELLRMGEGPASGPVALAALVVLRSLISLGAAEALAPGRPAFAVAAGLALPLHALLLPAVLAHALHGQWITLGAAALLFLGARWLPGSLRRPALVAAVLLAGLYFGEAARLSQAVASPGEV
jgi:hypothetical protein